jgi:hypothetical protein
MCLAVCFPDYIFLSLIIPFLRLGEALTGSDPFPLTSDAFKMVITGHASKDVLLSILHAVSKKLHHQFISFTEKEHRVVFLSKTLP